MNNPKEKLLIRDESNDTSFNFKIDREDNIFSWIIFLNWIKIYRQSPVKDNFRQIMQQFSKQLSKQCSFYKSNQIVFSEIKDLPK